MGEGLKRARAAAKATRAIVVTDLMGWILISQDDDVPGWHIAWIEPFETKKSAEQFATRNHWPKPWRAVRGRVTADHQQR